MRLRIESLAVGGEAVARADDGRVVFVDRGVPGDLVEVELVEEKARFARGTTLAIVEAGPQRVTPPCALAEACGGCPWQAVALPAQLAAKQAIVARALRALAVEIAAIVPSPASLGYRQRVALHARDGQLGMHAWRSHTLVALTGTPACPALDPRLDAALVAVRAAGLAAALGDDGELRATVVPSGAVQLALTAGRGAAPARLADRARALVGEAGIAGIVVGDQAFGAELLDAGDGAGPHLVSAGGFRQAQAAQNDALRVAVREALQPAGARVVELYAGDGNFTRDLVPAAHHVLAIEEDPAAVRRLQRNVPAVEAVVGRVERVLAARAAAGWDRVLLDPPRTGAKEALTAIAATGAERIVYVSCDPATLARDALRLVALGYRAELARPFDMMPHTAHVEVVVTFVRA